MKKILVIDDEPDLLELLKKRLEEHLYQVTTAANGVAGLACLDEEKPDLIVLDVMMPHLDGQEFVRLIKNQPQFAEIPILIFTAKPDLQALFQKEGIRHYIVKPFQAEDFLTKVKELIGQV